MKRHWAKKLFWWIFAGVTVTLALLLTAARAFYPYADSYRYEIEQWAGQQLGQPLMVKQMDARWRRLYPEVIFRDVSLLDEQGEEQSHLSELSFSLDLAALLFQQQLSFSHFNLMLDRLTLVRDQQGQISSPEFSLSTTPASSQTPSAQQRLLSWLLLQGDMRLRIAELQWQDQKSELEYQLHDLQLSLFNKGENHQLSAEIRLPEAMGKTLQLAVNVNGDPWLSDDWQAQLYVAGETLSLPAWLMGESIADQQINEGVLNFSLWSEWQGGELELLQGDVAFDNVELLSSNFVDQRQIDHAGASIDLQRLQAGWQLSLTSLSLNYQGHSWDVSGHQVRWDNSDPLSPQLALNSSWLDLADVSDFVSYLQLLPAETDLRLMQLEPKGQLKQLELQYLGVNQFNFLSDFEGVSVTAWEELPGVSNFTGWVALQPEQVQLQLDTKNALVHWPSLFRDTLPIAQLNGSFVGYRDDQGWQLKSPAFAVANSQLAAEAMLALHKQSDQSPFLELAVNFLRADMSATSRYLPSAIMPESVVEWIDQGVVAGQVTGGGMVYHGQLADFPFRKSEGSFDVVVDVEQAIIRPEEGWLPITEIDGQLHFGATTMDIDIHHGRLLDSEIRECQVTISDMLAADHYLNITGDVAAYTPDILEYLLSSPQRQHVEYLEMFRAAGRSDVALSLNIPLYSEGEFTFEGAASLQDNQLEIVPAMLPIEAISGKLQISSNGLQLDQVQGVLYGKPLYVEGGTQQSASETATLLQFDGRLSGKTLAEYLAQPMFNEWLLGESEFTGNLYIPHDFDAQRIPSLQLSSTLEGVEVALPGDFAKPETQSRKLMLDVEFAPQSLPVLHLDYGKQLAAVLAVEQQDLRGQIVLGAQTPQLPEVAGLELVGELSRFSLTELLPYLPQGQDTPASEPGILRRIQLKLASLELFSQEFEEVELFATQMSQQWLIKVDSPKAKGELQLSESILVDPLIANMERLYLAEMPESEEGEDGGFDMSKLPPLQVDIADFSYGKLRLGELLLTTNWVEGNYHFDELILTPQDTRISAQGEWLAGSGITGRTSLDLHIDSQNMGKSLAALGYADAFKNGKGVADASLTWPGGIVDYDAAALDGQVSFKFEDGRLLDVEPGAGRLLGLLSVQMLPRRLLLDFSDLFSKGFSFDEIRGNYIVQQGVAKTDSFVMMGPSARIDMLGEVNLAERSYDQQLIITPFVTESLPMLSFLTGVATPQVAAAIYFVQKLFQDDLEKIAQFEYHVSGPWENPEVKKVSERRAKE